MLISLLVLIGAAWAVSTLWLPLYDNWSTAQRLKVPVVVCPISRQGSMWRRFQTLLEAKLFVSWQTTFPFLRLLRPNWIFLEKYAIFETYGDVFAVVTPAGCELFIADSKAAQQILMRKNDFPKPIDLTRRLGVFGRSLATVDGADWSRHRRCTAVAFSDTIHEAVWTTSCSEASKALKNFISQEYISNSHPIMIRLSFAVLLKACLGMEGNDNNNAGVASPITDAAQIHLESFFSMLTRSHEARKGGQNPLASFHASYQGVKSFMSSLVKYRRHHPSLKKDLLSSMLSSHDAHMLSDEEIESNLFLFMFAGHETTANTLVYMIYLLAIYPEWQTWIVQEIDEIFSDLPVGNETSYKNMFYRLTRLKAMMYETLRLYGPVVDLLRRASPEQDQAVTRFDGSRVLIPANTLINILTPALHTHADFWGSDSLLWKPGRWLNNGNIDSDKVDHLLAWAEGPRACPGRKFSQLEISAVLVTLLRQATVHIVPRRGLSLKEARAEALRELQNSRSLLTLHIERPEAIHVRWCPRE